MTFVALAGDAVIRVPPGSRITGGGFSLFGDRKIEVSPGDGPGRTGPRCGDSFHIRLVLGLLVMSDGALAVIPSVIPPGTTPKTGGNQADGTADLTSMDVTGRHPMDGGEATHYRPTDWPKNYVGLGAPRARSATLDL